MPTGHHQRSSTLSSVAQPLERDRDRILARDAVAILLVSQLSLASESDCDYRAVCALARPDTGLCRCGFTRPCSLFRHRGLRRWPFLEICLGRADFRSAGGGTTSPAWSGYATSFIICRFRHLTLIMLTLGLGLLAFRSRQQRSLADRRLRWTARRAHLAALRHLQVRPLRLHGVQLFAWLYCSSFFLGMRRLVHSPFGLALRGIRENLVRMPAIGAASRAHIRKSLHHCRGCRRHRGRAPDANDRNPPALESISFQRSADVLVMLVLGGAGRLYGGV